MQVTVAQLPDEQLLELLHAHGFRPSGQIEYDSFVGFEDEFSEELIKYYAR